MILLTFDWWLCLWSGLDFDEVLWKRRSEDLSMSCPQCSLASQPHQLFYHTVFHPSNASNQLLLITNFIRSFHSSLAMNHCSELSSYLVLRWSRFWWAKHHGYGNDCPLDTGELEPPPCHASRFYSTSQTAVLCNDGQTRQRYRNNRRRNPIRTWCLQDSVLHYTDESNKTALERYSRDFRPSGYARWHTSLGFCDRKTGSCWYVEVHVRIVPLRLIVSV